MTMNSPYVIDPTQTGYGALLVRAQEELQRQAQAGSQQQQVGGDPDYQMYGIFGPQYAASLARPRGASGGDLLRHAALGMRADNEADAYGEALAAAGNRSLQEERIRGGAAAEVARIGRTREQPFSNETRVAPNEYGLFTMQTGDPVNQMLGDQFAGNEIQSGIVKNYSDSAQAASEAGLRIPPSTYSGQITPPTQDEPVPVGTYNDRQFNPDQETAQDKLPIDWYEAQTHRMNALTAQYQAQHPNASLRTTWVERGRVYALTQEGTAVDLGDAVAPDAGGVSPVPGAGGGQPSAGAEQGQMSPMQQGIAARVPQGYQQHMAGDMLIVVAPSGNAVAINPAGQRVPLQQGQQGQPPGGAQ